MFSKFQAPRFIDGVILLTFDFREAIDDLLSLEKQLSSMVECYANTLGHIYLESIH